MKKGFINKLLHLLSAIEDLLVFLFCFAFFLVGLYGLYDSYMIYRQANDSSILKFKPGYEEVLPEKEIQGNMVAWLTLEGTRIDYPVMQGDNNFEYLNKNPYGEYSLSGSIFLDYRNKPDFSDEYSLLYGHHMENGYMFGDLDRYRDKEFFDAHTGGTLHVNGEEKELRILAVLQVLATDEVIFNPEASSKEKVMEKVREEAVFKREGEGSRLVACSTCRFPSTAERTVVIAEVV